MSLRHPVSDTYVVETAVEKRCGTREICGKRSHKVLKETDMVEQEQDTLSIVLELHCNNLVSY